jgi:hypothetical protein
MITSSMKSSRAWVFIAGHHKSGTTLLQSIVRDHPDVSGFKNTGVPGDEGQHLQSVMKPASFYGGPGRYIFDVACHLNEQHPSATEQTARDLENQWLPYHDASKLVFLEKSPPNLVRTRFLQGLFPSCKFLAILRHPIAVAYATRKVADASLELLLAHTQMGYDILLNDIPHLNYCHIVRYEELIMNYQSQMQDIFNFLGLDYKKSSSFPRMVNKDNIYFKAWEIERGNLLPKQTRYIVNSIAPRSKEIGYGGYEDQSHGYYLVNNN